MDETQNTDGWPVLMRPKIAARFLGISEATLYRWIKDGKLVEPMQVSVGIRGWTRPELEKFAAKHFVREQEHDVEQEI